MAGSTSTAVLSYWLGLVDPLGVPGNDGAQEVKGHGLQGH